jgi:hypothetical protein
MEGRWLLANDNDRHDPKASVAPSSLWANCGSFIRACALVTLAVRERRAR